jgi:hypothetical protein
MILVTYALWKDTTKDTKAGRPLNRVISMPVTQRRTRPWSGAAPESFKTEARSAVLATTRTGRSVVFLMDGNGVRDSDRRGSGQLHPCAYCM